MLSIYDGLIYMYIELIQRHCENQISVIYQFTMQKILTQLPVLVNDGFIYMYIQLIQTVKIK